MGAAYTGERKTGEGCLRGRRNRPSAPNLPMVDTVPTGRVPDLEGCCYIGGLLLRVQRRNTKSPAGPTGCVTPSHF